MKNLHLLLDEKFTPGFIEISRKIVGVTNEYLIKNKAGISDSYNCNERQIRISELRKKIRQADRVFLHGMFSMYFVLILLSVNVKKLYWVLWGGDLYSTIWPTGLGGRVRALIKKRLAKKVDVIVSRVEGDFNLAKKFCSPQVIYAECLMYLSNVCTPFAVSSLDHAQKKILVGNSADPTNNHAKILKLLHKYRGIDKFVIVCPLSYGSTKYGDAIEALGKKMFPGKFLAIRSFMPLSEYNTILASVTHAIFCHDRQQAMGNIINLLGNGKKVFLNKHVTTYPMLKRAGFLVYGLDELDLNLIALDAAKHNTKIANEGFSKEVLVRDWNKIFHDHDTGNGCAIVQ